MMKNALRALTCAALATLLAACGGGGGGGASGDNAAAPPAAAVSPPAPAATAMSISGTVTGFGSVIIDGQRFDDQSASVHVDTDPAAPASASLSDVKLGMRVDGQVKDGKLSDVTIRAALVGKVGAVDPAASTFTVYQQTVSVVATGATPTVFEGVSGLAGLAVNDVVEVHGTVDAARQIVATRVERKARTETPTGMRLGGVVASLNAGAKTFKLNDLTVDFSAATVLPQGKTLADGQVVTVYSEQAPAAGVLLAKGVKIAGSDEGAGSGVGGRVMAFNSVADFTIAGVRIDASQATIQGGTQADIVLGATLAVEGKVQAGVLVAAKVRVLKTAEDVNASLSGAVTDFVSNASFKVRGTPVDASAASFTGGTASDLGNGANVKVSGKVKGDLVKADRVEFLQPPPSGPIKLKGEIRDYDAAAGTFHFLGVNLKLAADVQYVEGTAANLVNGRRVEVTGTKASASDTVDVSKVEFLPDLAPQVSVVGGRISDLAGNGFKLPGVAVQFNDATVFVGGLAADLANGIEVVVTGTWNPQARSLVVTRIEIRKPENRPSGIGVRGAITDFASLSSFRIGMQKVDASNATITDGTAADLANGRAVEGVGTLDGPEGARTLKLSQLRLLK